MPSLFLYLLKYSIAIGGFYLFYQLVLRRLTFYQWNRFYLMLYSLLCFFIPLIDITGIIEEELLSASRLNVIPTVAILATSDVATVDYGVKVFQTSAWDLVLVIFYTGILLMLVRLLKQYFSLMRIKRRATVTCYKEVWLYEVNQKINPFSFGNDIYINRLQHTDEELEKIIQHEFVHVKQKHTIDLMIGELVCIFNWFNPFAWLIRTAIRQNLEFIADNGVLSSGANLKQYQYLLLKVIGIPQYSITNHFSFSSLKKRIAMMNKLRSAKLHLVKFLFVLPVCAILLVAFRNNQKDNKPNIHAGISSSVDAKLLSGLIPRSENNILSESSDTILPPPPQVSSVATALPAPPTIITGAVPPAPPAKIAMAASPALPPIPAVAAQPSLPARVLPASVKSIQVDNQKIQVTLKNGKTEDYDLTNAAQKAAFEKMYGELPDPPHPPTAPVITPVSPVVPKKSGEQQAPMPTVINGISQDMIRNIIQQANNKVEIFMGIRNSLNIRFDNYRQENLVIEWPSGIIKMQHGIFYAYPMKPGKDKLTIYNKEADGSLKQLQTLYLDARNLPDPKSNPEFYKGNLPGPRKTDIKLWPAGSIWSPVKDGC